MSMKWRSTHDIFAIGEWLNTNLYGWRVWCQMFSVLALNMRFVDCKFIWWAWMLAALFRELVNFHWGGVPNLNRDPSVVRLWPTPILSVEQCSQWVLVHWYMVWPWLHALFSFSTRCLSVILGSQQNRSHQPSVQKTQWKIVWIIAP